MLADVLIAQGDLDGACAVATEILQATGALGSHIVVQQFLDLRRQLKPYRSSTAAAEFLGRLNPALRERLWFRRNFPADGQPAARASDGLA